MGLIVLLIRVVGRKRAKTETSIRSGEMKEVDLNSLVMDRPVINQTQTTRRRKSRNTKVCIDFICLKGCYFEGVLNGI